MALKWLLLFKIILIWVQTGTAQLEVIYKRYYIFNSRPISVVLFQKSLSIYLSFLILQDFYKKTPKNLNFINAKYLKMKQ